MPDLAGDRDHSLIPKKVLLLVGELDRHEDLLRLQGLQLLLDPAPGEVQQGPASQGKAMRAHML